MDKISAVLEHSEKPSM